MFYEGCSESNACCFITLAYDVRGGCWWYGSRGWTFPPILCYMLLPRDRWQQMDTLTKWCLTWKCIQSKGVSLNSPMWKKKSHSLTFIDAFLVFLETKQCVWVQWGSEWCISAVAIVIVVHLHWCRLLWAQQTGSCSWLIKMHNWWWWLYWKRVFRSQEFVLSNSVTVLFVLVVVSMEINRRYFFQSYCLCSPRQFVFAQCGPGKPKGWILMFYLCCNSNPLRSDCNIATFQAFLSGWLFSVLHLGLLFLPIPRTVAVFLERVHLDGGDGLAGGP